MSDINTGGPAFPSPAFELTQQRGSFPTVRGADLHRGPLQTGMTLRAYFAAAALQGMLAADGNDPRWIGKDTGPECQRGGGKWLDPAGVARQAFEIADAMIAQMDKPTEVADDSGPPH